MPGKKKTGVATPRRGSITYVSWRSMIERCRGYTETARRHYTGITVCDRWKDFENFLADMGERPGREYSIERKDSKGNYEPDNCKWATDIEQNRNRSNTRMLTIDGVIKPLVQWAEEYELTPAAIRQRINLGHKGSSLLAPKRMGHRIGCPGKPCSCPARRTYSPAEKIANAVRRHQAKGTPATLRLLSKRAGLTQSETIEICRELGFVLMSDGGKWMRNWTVVEGENFNG